MTRHIDFEGIENFRDFGGYATACGRGMKSGVLFRSANHAKATDADLQALRDLGVSVVVDLRRTGERQREPSRRWDGFAASVIENDIEGDYEDWDKVLREVEPDAAWFHNDGIRFYQNAPREPRHVDLFRRYFQALAETDGAVVVHCAAGKDRTGMICALTHHIAGVHRDDLLADYLLTNDPDRIARRGAALRAWMRDHIGKEVDDEALNAALSVHPEYLERAFATIEASHGSLDGYLEQVLGVDAALRERISAKILA